MVGDMASTAAASLAQSASLWSAVAEWFTPTVFFVLLNVVIGTIAVTSKSLSHHHAHSSGGGAKPGAEHRYHGADDQVQYDDAAPPPARQLSRTGSMLQRLKSFNLNFHMYRGDHPEDHGLQVAAAVPDEPQKKPRRRDPSPPRRQKHPEEELPNGAAEFETLEEAFLAAAGTTHLNRIQSDTHPTAGEMPRKLAATMMKSASTKSAASHMEARDLPRRPATTRDDRPSSLVEPPSADDDEVLGAGQPRANTEVDARADDFINRFRQQLKLQRLESLMRYRDMLNRGR